MEKEFYYYWLANVPGIGRMTMKKLLEVTTPEKLYKNGFKGMEEILKKSQLEAWEKYAQTSIFRQEWKKLQEEGIQFLCPESEAYPKKLGQIPDPPLTLYKKGRMESMEVPSVAVVGARNCSAYGSLAAKELGRELAGQGITVISGMARGIDGISQWSALEADGESIGVLGSGVGVCYPKENRPLYERLQKQGCILSENPPHTAPRPGLFPLRNRLISGLADALVVVEAGEKSGTLITVDMALEQGKEIYAMPGRITDKLSGGCNRLIGQGAEILLSPREFARQMAERLGTRRKEEREQKGESVMTMREESIFAVLEPLPMSVEEIWQRGREKNPGLTLAQVMEDLLALVMKGRVRTHEQYFYRAYFG
ncbi:MAG: DNA-processing protein DprA [Lachnospiraceae bacterium]